MFKILFGFLFIFFSGISMTAPKDPLPRLIVWNVGQGLWVTEVTWNSCIHFDAGGEKAAWKRVLKHCHGKQNIFFLSHADWDHFRFFENALKKLTDICFSLPKLEWIEPWKKNRLRHLPKCQMPVRDYELWDPERDLPQDIFESLKRKTKTNQRSRIFRSVLFQSVIPGDSTQAQEKKWSHLLKTHPPRIFLLGHHGSRTSTATELIDNMRSATMMIASARYARYRHPHVSVQRRIRDKKRPLVRTEDWGHLIFLK